MTVTVIITLATKVNRRGSTVIATVGSNKRVSMLTGTTVSPIQIGGGRACSAYASTGETAGNAIEGTISASRVKVLKRLRVVETSDPGIDGPATATIS